MTAIPHDASAPVRRVSSREAASLAEGGAIVLDVRSPGEFTGLGHMPGAWLLPVDLFASAPALLPDRDAPTLVYCEHAVRSRHAAALLVRAGYTQVHELAGGFAEWDGPREYDEAPVRGPSRWLLECVDLLPRGGQALDLACGSGRHALLLASAGFAVTAIDRDGARLERLAGIARRLDLPVEATNTDLETAVPPDLGVALYQLVVVTHYLHRPLFPSIIRALAPRGLLLYETFMTPPAGSDAQAPGPSNPAFRLAPGELASLVAPLTIVRSFEGFRDDGAAVAAVAARRENDITGPSASGPRALSPEP